MTVKNMWATFHSLGKIADPSTSHINHVGNKYLQENNANSVELLILRLAIFMAN